MLSPLHVAGVLLCVCTSSSTVVVLLSELKLCSRMCPSLNSGGEATAQEIKNNCVQGAN